MAKKEKMWEHKRTKNGLSLFIIDYSKLPTINLKVCLEESGDIVDFKFKKKKKKN